MRTLVYKRTHPFDPGKDGIFGSQDCMGKVRTYNFDAIIGIGGIGPEPRSFGIDGKVNWVGIGPHKVGRNGRGPLLAFDHFILLEDKGEKLSLLAPFLEKRFCHSKGPRYILDRFSKRELIEIDKILLLAKQKRSPRKTTSQSLVQRSCKKIPQRG